MVATFAAHVTASGRTEISIAGKSIVSASAEDKAHVQRSLGVMYQSGALFGSLTVLENVRFPLDQFTDLGLAEKNLTARLQSHSDIDGILLGHETYSLVKGEVAAEEQTPIKVKGFAEPIRCYKVQGLYDQLAEEGTVIREEQEGFKFHLNLQKRHKAEAISILEGILSRLKA